VNRTRSDEVAGFVLAGGRSSRMGRDKALLEIGGQPLVVRAARCLEPLVASVTIIGPAEIFQPLGYPTLADVQAGLGPLGGILTALRHTDRSWNFLLACDMPYVHRDWLAFLIGRALQSFADVILPESDAGPEPLCSLCNRRGAPAIETAIAGGVRKVTDALGILKVERISAGESKPFDSEGLLFQNLNSMADYEQARARLEVKKG
jgi:molybdopterin-guanine dinucleotide biosynthesis protein A